MTARTQPRHIYSLLALAVTALIFAGCSGNTDSGPEADHSHSDPVVLEDTTQALTAARAFALSHARYMLGQSPRSAVKSVSPSLRLELSTFEVPRDQRSRFRDIRLQSLTLRPRSSTQAFATGRLRTGKATWPTLFEMSLIDGRWLATAITQAH